MGKFATVLNEIMERKELTGAELSEASGLLPSLISTLRSGERDWLSNSDMEKLLAAISNGTDRAELLKARLLDQMVGPGSELLDVVVRTGYEAEALHDRKRNAVRLPSRYRKAIDCIETALQDDHDLQELILYLAKIYCRPKEKHK